MNEQRLAQLLRETDDREFAPLVRDAASIATAARSIRRARQQRSRLIVSACSVLLVVGSLALMIGWRNVEDRRARHQAQMVALQSQADQLDDEASERMNVIDAVIRSKKPTKAKQQAKPRDVSFELDIERERAAAIILQAADQLREAGRIDLGLDRYHDLISLFPDTAAAQLARERIEQSKNRT